MLRYTYTIGNFSIIGYHTKFMYIGDLEQIKFCTVTRTPNKSNLFKMGPQVSTVNRFKSFKNWEISASSLR